MNYTQLIIFFGFFCMPQLSNAVPFKNVLNSGPSQEKIHIPEALITVGNGATDLAKHGVYIQAQESLTNSLNNVAEGAQALAQNGIAIKTPELNIELIKNSFISAVKTSSIAMVGTAISVVSLYALFKSIHALETHPIENNYNKKETLSMQPNPFRIRTALLPLASIFGIGIGVLIIKHCEQIAH